jgi:hypothetical protein
MISRQFVSDLAAAHGIPSGQVVRLVTVEKGGAGAISLVEVRTGPLPDETFAVPSGYQQTVAPGRR